jgi:hypothetical protein
MALAKFPARVEVFVLVVTWLIVKMESEPCLKLNLSARFAAKILSVTALAAAM